jgi:serine/threonine protein kinase
MNPDNVQALPIGTQLGDFRLDVMIGHGSFGITYRAFDTQLAKIVAIKEYLPVAFAVREGGRKVVPRGARFADDFAWGRERFLDEARALARFRHPHIVPVLRYFEDNGTAYTVMEFEDGRSVAELLREPGRGLPPDDVRRLADGLLSGLAAVHAQNFLHRDIKPSNIIIRRDSVPILIDFGAARLAMSGRTHTLTGVLTPQYAPIEQYALEGKQGPWSDIYSAAAVLHHAITGRTPPEAASRVGADPYRPLARSEAGRFDDAFLAAVDRALAFAGNERPQSVAEWRTSFGTSLPSAQDAPTQRMPAATAPRLGGVNRERHEPLRAPPAAPSRAGLWSGVVLILLAGAAAAWWFEPAVRDVLASATQGQTPSTPAASSQTASSETSPPQHSVAPAGPAALTPAPATPSSAPPDSATLPQPTPIKPTPSAAATTAPLADSPESLAQKALVGQADREAARARAAAEKAKEAADAGRASAGEARIAAARAARPGLENAERLSYPNGASYIGQTEAGQRQGLGVAELDTGEHQAGEWKADRLNGLGTVRLSDGSRYEGQWRDGQSTGLGVREKPGVERAEGNFVDGRLEGLGVRRQMTSPGLVQSGEFHADLLDGVGVETLADGERYEGEFRAGRRQGYGKLVSADGKVRPGRWDSGKLAESAR